MPSLDHDEDVIVVRVVYDGPPLSGKTTSVTSLASKVGAEVVTPDEVAGRTIYFDWMDYVGGLYAGRRIRCQIVSVPGQRQFRKRRLHLLASADAVVFVADTRSEAFQESCAMLAEIVPVCARPNPPVGIVVQANKRDASDCAPLATVRESLDRIAPMGLVETSAISGDGVREAFVFAIRLALDRVRCLTGEGRLSTEVSIRTPDALLAELEQNAKPSRRPVRVAPGGAREVVFRADANPPSGCVWPPVEGRLNLRNIATMGVDFVADESGDWWGSAGPWLCHSRAAALYGDAEHARGALLDWARAHVAARGLLSEGRTLVLADAGDGRHRLWQLVRRAPSLEDGVLRAMKNCGPREAATELLQAARGLIQARRGTRRCGLALPCTISTIGPLAHGFQFVGLVPTAPAESAVELQGEALLRRELTPLLERIARERPDADAVWNRLRMCTTESSEEIRAVLGAPNRERARSA